MPQAKRKKNPNRVGGLYPDAPPASQGQKFLGPVDSAALSLLFSRLKFNVGDVVTCRAGGFTGMVLNRNIKETIAGTVVHSYLVSSPTLGNREFFEIELHSKEPDVALAR